MYTRKDCCAVSTLTIIAWHTFHTRRFPLFFCMRCMRARKVVPGKVDMVTEYFGKLLKRRVPSGWPSERASKRRPWGWMDLVCAAWFSAFCHSTKKSIPTQQNLCPPSPSVSSYFIYLFVCVCVSRTCFVALFWLWEKGGVCVSPGPGVSVLRSDVGENHVFIFILFCFLLGLIHVIDSLFERSTLDRHSLRRAQGSDSDSEFRMCSPFFQMYIYTFFFYKGVKTRPAVQTTTVTRR